MVLNFPSNPSINDTYSSGSGIQYVWDGVRWKAGQTSPYAPIDNPIFTGTVTLPGDPTTALEAATKQYVDANGGGGGGGASVSVSATAPTSPADGDLWWDTDSVSLYVYHDDGTSAQWMKPQRPQVCFCFCIVSSSTNPSEGDLWWLETTYPYVYYNDGTSSQWVETNSVRVTLSSTGGGVPCLCRNCRSL